MKVCNVRLAVLQPSWPQLRMHPLMRRPLYLMTFIHPQWLCLPISVSDVVPPLSTTQSRTIKEKPASAENKSRKWSKRDQRQLKQNNKIQTGNPPSERRFRKIMDCFGSFSKLLKYMFNGKSKRHIGIERLPRCVRNLSHISAKTELFYKQVHCFIYIFYTSFPILSFTTRVNNSAETL